MAPQTTNKEKKMTKLLNLDKLVKPDKTVVLNGVEWKLPNSLSVQTALKMRDLGAKLQEDPSMDNMNEAYKLLYEEFNNYNEDFIKYEKFTSYLDIDRYKALCNFIAGVEQEEEEVDASKKNEQLE